MKNTQNITILLLLASGTILASMLISTYSTPVAKGESSIQQGDYIFATGAYSNSKDLLYVLNHRTSRLNVYALNPKTDSIDIVENVDILKAFEQERRFGR
jgi:hypothetical protein